MLHSRKKKGGITNEKNPVGIDKSLQSFYRRLRLRLWWWGLYRRILYERGEISGNTVVSASGSGVYVYSNGIFTKTAGVIYGSNGGIFKNTAVSDGHAVYVAVASSSADKKRNTTAGPGVALDSSINGSAGGWE
jgi:hypothetical protein